jgi:hypothetical protein
MRKITLLLTLAFLAVKVNAQWQEVGAPIKSVVASTYAFATVGSNIFAGLNGGIVRSTDSGATWIQTGMTVGTIQAIVISGGNIFAGTSMDGVYLSMDTGTTFNQVNNGLSGNAKWVHCLALSGTDIFVGTKNGVYLSTNNGGNWVPVSTGLPSNSTVRALAINGNNIFAGVSAMGINGIYLSTNNGSNWTAVNNGLGNPVPEIFSLTVRGNDIFAGTRGYIYISSNNGGNWIQLNNGLPPGVEYAAITVNSNTIFAGTRYAFSSGIISRGIYKSIDNGASWSPSGLDYYSISAITIIGANIFVGSTSGISLSTDNGATWAFRNDAYPNDDFHKAPTYALIRYGANIFAAAGTLQISTDNGNNWAPMLTYCAALAIDSPYIFSGTSISVYRSSNNGLSWNNGSSGIPNNTVVHALAVKDTIVIASAYGSFGQGVYKSIDRGLNFTLSGLSSAPYVVSLIIMGNKVFAGTLSHGGIWVSPNNGIGWDSIPLLSGKTINELTIDGTKIYAGTSSGVYVSTDTGATWSNTGIVGLTDTAVTALAVSGNNIFAGTGFLTSQIYFSNNGGATWTATGYASSFSSIDVKISSLLIDGSNIFAGTDGGLYPSYGIIKRALSNFPTAVEQVNYGLDFSIFPNPVNNELTIENGELQIELVEIYNVMGKICLRSDLPYRTINVSSLIPGIYFVTVADKNGNKIAKKFVKM